MLPKLLTSIFGSRNDRLLKQYRHVVQKDNAFEPAFEQLSDTELRAKTEEFRNRHAKGESLDALLPEAFAAVREASKRTLKMRHFDVQLIGGMVLHDGKIAEMRTGEGKTLVATLPVYLNSLAGKGVHLVTVNDYLARRDAEWMGRLYNFLGLSVGVNLPQMSKEDKQAAYAADHLDVEVAHPERALRRLADGGESLGEDLVERLAAGQLVPELDGLRRQLLVREAFERRLVSGDLANDLVERLDVTVVGRAEDGLGDGAEHGGVPGVGSENTAKRRRTRRRLVRTRKVAAGCGYSSRRSPYWIEGIRTNTLAGTRGRMRSRRSRVAWPWTSAACAAIAEAPPPVRAPFSTRSTSAESAGAIRACAGATVSPVSTARRVRKRRRVRSIAAAR